MSVITTLDWVESKNNNETDLSSERNVFTTLYV